MKLSIVLFATAMYFAIPDTAVAQLLDSNSYENEIEYFLNALQQINENQETTTPTPYDSTIPGGEETTIIGSEETSTYDPYIDEISDDRSAHYHLNQHRQTGKQAIHKDSREQPKHHRGHSRHHGDNKRTDKNHSDKHNVGKHHADIHHTNKHHIKGKNAEKNHDKTPDKHHQQ